MLSALDDPELDAVCAEPGRLKVRCFLSEPPRTSGEARPIGELACAHGWESLAMVIPTPTHPGRVLVRQCTDAEVQCRRRPHRSTFRRPARPRVWRPGARSPSTAAVE